MPDIAQTGAVLVCSDGTGAAPITGAPAAYCFDIHAREPRGIRGLVLRNIIGTSGFSIGRYHASAEKGAYVKVLVACKFRQTGRLRIFSRVVNGERRELFLLAEEVHVAGGVASDDCSVVREIGRASCRERV